jgi:osmotically-inducible protein OsmY
MSIHDKISCKKILAGSMTLLIAGIVNAATPPTPAKEVDNTKMNQRDSQSNTLTPEDQSQASNADVELTRRIRQELVNDKSLSTNAQNVKIITVNGVATLRGPVESTTEKSKVESLAKKVSGVSGVVNQIEVKTKSY